MWFFFFFVQSPVIETTKPIPNEDEQNGEEPDDELELPPPMKPISESILVASDTTSSVSSQRVSKEYLQHVNVLTYYFIYSYSINAETLRVFKI